MRAAGNEGGIDAQRGSAGVAALLDISKAAFLAFAWPAADAAEGSGMVVGGEALSAGDGPHQTARAPFGDVPGQERLDWLGRRCGGGDIHQRLMAHDKEGRLVGANSLRFAPLPKFS